MITLEQVSFAYGLKSPLVLTNIDLQLRQEEVTALVGPNGCGKTTLSKLMVGILKPAQGRVLVNGMDTKYTELSSLGKMIGYLFQEPERQLFAPTVREELSFVADLMGRKEDGARARVERLLERFQLRDLAGDFPFQLSRGEKQRLAIAAVMVNEPEYYVFDEPTTGLDELRRKDLSEIFNSFVASRIGMLIISHDKALVRRHAQRLIRLEGGRIVEDCTVP